jgi:putative colanic acid biosynthesis UDP-glucose lipid carrier transferase
MMLVDGLLVYLIGYLSLFGLSVLTWRTLLDESQYWPVITLSAIAFPLIMQLFGAYRYQSAINLPRALMRNFLSWSAVVGTAMILTVIFKTSSLYSRMWVGVWASSTLVVLLLVQSGYWSLLRYQRSLGIGVRRIVVVGKGQHLQELIEDVAADENAAYSVITYFSDIDLGMPLATRYGGVDEALDVLHGRLSGDVDEVWVMQSAVSDALSERLFRSAELRLFEVRFIPELRGFAVPVGDLEHLGTHVVIGLSVQPQLGAEGLAKTILDRSTAFIGLLLLSPLLLLLALVVRLDSAGPSLFRQQRHGLKGVPFWILKFRTLTVDSAHRPGEPLQQVRAADPRVTPLGHWMRRWSLDELPQLWNVLRGDMSLVGPRPHELGMNQNAASRDFEYRLRHRVKPGMTGWAQIHGYRGPAHTDEAMAQRVEHDLWYIDNWSFWLDLRILLRTLKLVLRPGE